MVSAGVPLRGMKRESGENPVQFPLLYVRCTLVAEMLTDTLCHWSITGKASVTDKSEDLPSAFVYTETCGRSGRNDIVCKSCIDIRRIDCGGL